MMHRFVAQIRRPGVFILTVLVILLIGLLVQFTGSRTSAERAEDAAKSAQDSAQAAEQNTQATNRNTLALSNLARDNHVLLKTITECLENSGECGKRNDRQTKAVLALFAQQAIAANYCSSLMLALPATQTLAGYTDCVVRTTPQVELPEGGN